MPMHQTYALTHLSFRLHVPNSAKVVGVLDETHRTAKTSHIIMMGPKNGAISQKSHLVCALLLVCTKSYILGRKTAFNALFIRISSPLYPINIEIPMHIFCALKSYHHQKHPTRNSSKLTQNYHPKNHQVPRKNQIRCPQTTPLGTIPVLLA